ncbi:Ig-like domain-containing protein [Gracilimonas sp.]|uniref:Ig-like domain-containing protein n=1 Tax=Gracilimonas sp. TaxID=1974203 RepID=UPI0028722BDA|nr:Ig-like domain-containing protein [Gracilimonas sp.]
MTNTQPEPGETAVAIDGNIQIDFSDSFQSVDFSQISIEDGLAIPVTGLDFSTPNDNTTLLIFPPNLDPLTTYTVTIPSAAIQELENDFSFSFTTGDPFSVTETTPANNTSGVSLDPEVRVSYNKPFNIYGGALVSLNGNGLPFSSLSVEEDSILVIDTPVLDPSTNYSIEIASGSFESEDLKYNDAYTFGFETGSRPGINYTIPSNLATEVDTGSGSLIQFKELVTVEEEANLVLTDSTGTPVSYDLTLRNPFFSDGKLVVTSVESALGGVQGLQEGMPYVAVLDSGLVRNTNGIVNDQYTWTFETKSYPPDIVSKSPDSLDYDVDLKNDLNINFNKPVEILDAQKITITDETENAVSGINPYLDLGEKSTGTGSSYATGVGISHDDFVADKIYTIEIDQGAFQTESEAQNSGYSWKFSTYSNPFLQVSATSPVDDAVEVPIDTDVSVTFNQTVTANDLSGVIFSQNSEVPVPNTNVSVSGNKLNISHDGLLAGTGYFVSIPSNAVQNTDEIGNESLYFSFTTESATPLTVVETIPEDESNGIPIDTEVSVTFDQNIEANNLSQIFIGDIIAEETVSGTSVIISGNKLTINHPDLNFDTEYIVQVPAGAVETSDGAINSLVSWQFRTIAGSPPELVSVQPEDGATNVPIDAVVSAQFDSDILSSNLSDISIEDEAGNEISGITPEINSDELLIGHDDFEYDHTYIVTIPEQVLESDTGLYNSEITWSFTTVPSPPEITSTNPEDGSTGVAVDTEITATFDKGILEQDLTNIEIVDEAGNSLSGISASISGSELTITNPGLELGTTYTISIGDGTVINVGDIPNEAYSWSFTTILGIPEVIELSPEDGSDEVSVEAPITAKFNQPINEGDLSEIRLENDSGTAVENVSAAVEGTQLTLFHPELDRGTTYTVIISAGAIVNEDQVYNEAFTWSFTTLLEVPQVTSVSPEDGASGVAVDAPITAEFSQSLNTGDLSGVRLEDGSGSGVSNVTAAIEGSQLTLSHPELDRGTTYTVSIPSGVVENSDGVGNEEVSWEFSTILSAPEVSAVIPGENATAIPVDVLITVEFSQPVTAGELTGIQLEDGSGAEVQNVSASVDGSDLVLSHSELDRGTAYTVTIPSGAVINSDQVYNEFFEWSFTTLLSAPEVTDVAPAENATAVSVDTEITIDFNQPVSEGNLNLINIISDIGEEVGGLNFTMTETGLEITHDDLQNLTTYTVTIPSGAVVNSDEVGNEFFEWSFTTVQAVSEEVTVSVNRDFGEASTSNDYRLVALPGDINVPLDEVLEGNAVESWNAFWDNGAPEDFMIEYDGSDTFTLKPGNGFWLISASDFSYDQTISAAKLNELNQAEISLHEGWNIISNPLDVDVSWSEVEQANEMALQPLWAFNEVFEEREVFESASGGEAFYFFNKSGLEHLKIPYIEHSSSEKESSNENRIILSTSDDGEVSSQSELVLVEGELEQNQLSYIYSPPTGFESSSLRFVHERLKDSNSRIGNLAKLYHTYNEAGQTFEMELKAESGSSVKISLDEMGQNNQIHEVVILNKESGIAYDFRGKESVDINVQQESTELLLVVGTKEYLKEEHSNYLPDEININRNYPNPFNPTTTLSFSIPELNPVQVNVYNMLGQKVATLVDNKNMPAGSHQLTFDASGYASGLFIVEYRIGEESYTQKILLIK